jgi:hypothetical protein
VGPRVGLNAVVGIFGHKLCSPVRNKKTIRWGGLVVCTLHIILSYRIKLLPLLKFIS